MDGAAQAMESPASLKIGYRGEIHRIRVDLATFGFHDLQELFASTFRLCHGSIAIQYKDDQRGSIVHDAIDSLRFFAVSNTEAMFHGHVAESMRTGAVVQQDQLDTCSLSALTLHNPHDAVVVYTATDQAVDVSLAPTQCTIERSLQLNNLGKLPNPAMPNPSTSDDPRGLAKWAAELALVRIIVPNADTAILVALLETSKGNVHVVMDALTS
ncbi:hypothetical protein H257_12246 [Aphanomyces astaci]|uniref:PB1 domain-containing protein n=1 Tax=Aphanomyces astaci TaxID=112090 RepID=W4G1U9_APHAT|nr:hypothetical protein H257_12246 [Aphanomyces astaci]ETV72913.1 hypothetical protein H257_12246 [Aphanomyces astaci]|eukprot:XP_009837699.1 hypothetical protein H257_12246 [Aphanomyces astaci]